MDAPRPTSVRAAPRLESLFVATLVLLGFRLGVRPIADNSMLTHLRTGIDMVAGQGIPRVDPYSYTSPGRSWVVQSWLAEWTYGWAHRLGGFRLVVLEQALLTASLAWLIVRLARAGTPLRTALAGSLAVGVGAAFWSPRPLLFGLVCMALLVSVVEGGRSRWWLVPLAWVWVNTHGSFPLGLVWLLARALGEGLDARSLPRPALRHAAAFVLGLGAAAANPLGPRLLLFPFTLAAKEPAFRNIVEWQSPNFQTGAGRAALVSLAVALVVLLRGRVPWRDAVPSVVFLVAGLVALRNLPVTAVVLAPALGRALRAPARPAPAVDPSSAAAEAPSPGRPRLNRAVAGVLAVAFAVFGASVWTQPPLRLAAYPSAATRYLRDNHLLAAPHRLAHQDFVGNYLSFRFGRTAKVFIDDRYDMYPLAVSRDYRTLLGAGPDALAVLDRRGVDVVLWDRRLALVTVLEASDRWRQAFRKGEWVVMRRH